jgi:hypothetical protein
LAAPREALFIGTSRDIVLPMSLITGAGNISRTMGGSRAIATYRQQARFTTSMAGTNNDLTFWAKAMGTGGNAITVRIVVAGASTALSVSVSGNAITINSATSAGSAATSTAAQVRTAVLAHAPAMALLSKVEFAPGNDGTGVVAAFGPSNLAAGTFDEWGLGSGTWARRGPAGSGFSSI